MSKRTLALRWMQSIKSKTEHEQSNKVERNNSKLKEIIKVITIKVSDIINRYITVGASKNEGNQIKIVIKQLSTVIVIITTIVTSSGKVKVMINILIIMLLMVLQIRRMMI